MSSDVLIFLFVDGLMYGLPLFLKKKLLSVANGLFRGVLFEDEASRSLVESL